jgi:aminopeptidase N
MAGATARMHPFGGHWNVMNNIGTHYLLALSLLALAACGPADAPTEITAPETATTATADGAPRGRLPEGVRPQAYRLDLALDPRKDDFSGNVEIDIGLDDPSTRIWMHGEGLDVTTTTAVLADGAEVAASYEESPVTGVSRVAFADELPAGTFTLRLQYRASFNRNLAGLFKVEEQGESYVLAKSESIQARKFLPGFDEPGLKATYDISLTIPAGYTAIGNSPEMDREFAGDGMETVTFATTRPMPTYLLSLAVGPFDTVERAAIPPNEYRDRPIPLRGFSRKGRGGDMNYVLDITPRMVEIFERELQRPYPFEKLDIVAAPQWPSGATELSAAITYREQSILVGDDPAPGARLALLGVHSHELSHMWFGNLVTPPWWDDLWLKEGFATWSEPVVLTLFEPEGGHDVDAIATSISAMQLDSLASTRAIREPIADNDEIRNAYDAITYSKSLGVIHMVDHYFGAEQFRPALGRYIESFADGVADSPDFYRVIGQETGTPALTETFRSFIEQKGVPQLDVTLQCDGGAQPMLTIEQSRYKPQGSPITEAAQRWTIPVCIRSDTGADQCLMLTEALQSVALQGTQCPQWVMPNAGGSGYYRWSLASAQWQSLIRNFSVFTPVEALSIIDSAFAAFEAGTLSASILLQVVQQSAQASQRQVILAPLSYLRKYRRNYLTVADEPAFLQFARTLYGPVLAGTAGSLNSDEQLLHSELTSFMALTAKDPSSRQQLRESAYAFTGFGGNRDADALDSDQYLAALIVAVQDGGAEFLAHLLTVRTELDDPRFESTSASAIGRTTDAALLSTARELAFSEQLGPRETFSLVSNSMIEPGLREQNWQWLQGNFAAIVGKVPDQWRRFTPRFGNVFCSADKLAEVRRLFERNGNLVPGHQRSLAQTEEQIQLCMALRERGQLLASALSGW